MLEKEHAAKHGGKEIKMIDIPHYKMDERLGCHREVDIPSSLLFEPLGWDRDPANPKEKHYRKFTPGPLEEEP